MKCKAGTHQVGRRCVKIAKARAGIHKGDMVMNWVTGAYVGGVWDESLADDEISLIGRVTEADPKHDKYTVDFGTSISTFPRKHIKKLKNIPPSAVGSFYGDGSDW